MERAMKVAKFTFYVGRPAILAIGTAALVLGAVAAEARERIEFYNGVRGLGMGGAAIATVNDETSILVNPAGLGKLRDSFLTIADPELSVGAETQAIVGADWLAAFDPQEVLDLLQEGNHTAKHFHQAAQAFPSFVVPNFGIGVFGDYITNANLDATGANYNLRYRNDYAFVLGYNFRIWDGRIKLGFNTRVVNRVEIDTTLPANSTGLKVSSLAQEGLGVASDVGLMLTAPWAWLPTIAAVYRDAGNTRYTVQDGLFLSASERPETTPATLDAAFSLFPIVGKKTRMTVTGEYRDVMDAYKENDLNRRIHAGLEFNFSDAFFLRGGMNQRYWTAGLELAMFNYQLQIASYGEDIGTVDEPREDRRYVFKFAYRF